MTSKDLVNILAMSLVVVVFLLGIVWWIDTYAPPVYTKVDGQCVVETEAPNLFGSHHEIARVCGVSPE